MAYQDRGSIISTASDLPNEAPIRLGFPLDPIATMTVARGRVKVASPTPLARLPQTPMMQANSLSLERICTHTPNVQC